MKHNLFNDSEKQQILSYVRQIIVAEFDRETAPEISALDGKLEQELACFVTLHTKNGQLRGCIGNIEPFETLAQNLARNALNAAFNDPRFPPLAIDEVAEVIIEVSILTPMQSIENFNEFSVGKHGVVIEKDGRSAVFLPQVAPEQGWNAEETLRYLSQKAGLEANAWQEPDAKFKVFEAIVFSEDSLG